MSSDNQENNSNKYNFKYVRRIMLEYLDACFTHSILSKKYSEFLQNVVKETFNKLKCKTELDYLGCLWEELKKYSGTEEVILTIEQTDDQANLISKNQILVNEQFLVNVFFRKKCYRVLGGIENISVRCYINTALQALCQIYETNKPLFESTQLGKKLQLLHSQKSADTISRDLLYYFYELSDSTQVHTSRGGDSYVSLITFLFKLKEQLSEDKEELFNELFCLETIDGLKCQTQYCGKYKEKLRKESLNEDKYAYLEQPVLGIEVKKIEDAFKPKSCFSGLVTNEKCDECYQQYLKSEITIKSFPQFLIVNILDKHQTTQNNDQINKMFSFSETKSPPNYQIIGLGYHVYDSHYIYQRKTQKEGGWISYNDSSVLYDQPTMKNVKFVVLRKINES